MEKNEVSQAGISIGADENLNVSNFEIYDLSCGEGESG